MIVECGYQRQALAFLNPLLQTITADGSRLGEYLKKTILFLGQGVLLTVDIEVIIIFISMKKDNLDQPLRTISPWVLNFVRKAAAGRGVSLGSTWR